MSVTNNITNTLRAESHHPPCVIDESAYIPLEHHPTDGRIKLSKDGIVQTLTSRMGTGGNNTPLLLKIRSGCKGGGKGPLIQMNKSATISCNNDQVLFVPKFYVICSNNSNSMKSDNPNSGLYETETSRTLDANGGNPTCNQGGTVVCYSIGNRTQEKQLIRRLTPTECERLQGFPDGWTDIGEWIDSKGKRRKSADSLRYKALGNSIALPQWWWITCKMANYLPYSATLGSLFDGIGGFPLVWETRHGKGTAVWASEIEEFPIEVTKKWFPIQEERKS